MHNKLKVLIVDDSPLVAPRVRSLLDNIDPALLIGESYSAEEALELMKEVVPNIILLDLNLPGKTGIEMLSELKGRRPEVIVIVFTNHSEPYYRTICKELGADYFFDKSTEFYMLPVLLQELSENAVLC